MKLIKAKRRIQNKLRAIDSNTRIRGVNMLHLCLQKPPVLQKPSMTDKEYRYWTLNESHYKKKFRYSLKELAKNYNSSNTKTGIRHWRN